jgi:hypothetical protein
MKTDIDPLPSAFKLCTATGRFREKRPDKELVKSLVKVAEMGLTFINRKAKDIPKESTDWTFVFRDHYESLRGLIEAYLLLDGVEAESHQCKNAYLCFKHPELDLDWGFLEMIRLKRNAINYRGQLLDYDDWKMFKLKFDLHIGLLKSEISGRLQA